MRCVSFSLCAKVTFASRGAPTRAGGVAEAFTFWASFVASDLSCLWSLVLFAEYGGGYGGMGPY